MYVKLFLVSSFIIIISPFKSKSIFSSLFLFVYSIFHQLHRSSLILTTLQNDESDRRAETLELLMNLELKLVSFYHCFILLFRHRANKQTKPQKIIKKCSIKNNDFKII